MFLLVNVLNEGKGAIHNSKINQSGLSEGENPKSAGIHTKMTTRETTKRSGCVNSNWQKLR